jgi:hypothetical protein
MSQEGGGVQMSDLKPFNSERIYWAVEQVEREAGDIDTLHLDDNLFYLKSEADEVIAEKDKELRRHKYKRCLAMAKWCEDKVDAIKNGYMISGITDRYGVMTTCPPECNPKFSFYEKWHRRWLELAEKFKEAK